MPRSGPIIGVLTVPGIVKEVRITRNFVGELLEGWPCRDSAVLLTSELVTNSILHSRSGDGGKVTVVVIDLGTSARVEVIDDGSDQTPRTHSGQAHLADDGRGLRIVEAVASSWGATGDDHGTTTWFQLDAEPHPEHLPAKSADDDRHARTVTATQIARQNTAP